MELVPVPFLKKGTSSRNFRSLNEFLTGTAHHCVYIYLVITGDQSTCSNAIELNSTSPQYLISSDGVDGLLLDDFVQTPHRQMAAAAVAAINCSFEVSVIER